MEEEIRYHGIILAIVKRSDSEVDGTHFFTPPEYPLQVGVLIHSKGSQIKPHVHKNNKKVIQQIQEALHVVYGKIEVEFFQKDGKMIGSTFLTMGDTILLVSGGHGINILENSKIIEVKQGPYFGWDEDKELV